MLARFCCLISALYETESDRLSRKVSVVLLTRLCGGSEVRQCVARYVHVDSAGDEQIER